MINKWKVTAIVITSLAKMALVSPAVAQSFDPEIGTGNVVMMQEQVIGLHQVAAARRNGLDDFAMVPRAQANDASQDPASTGGGSAGYNENLRLY